MNKVGVITVTYNSGKVIDNFMQTLLQQTHPNFILYLVDNHSQDTTLSQISNYVDSRVKIIAQQENLGFAQGTNIGIRQAQSDACDLIFLVNNDTYLPPNLISQLIADLFFSEADYIAPKIMLGQLGSQQIMWAGGVFRQNLAYLVKYRGLNQIDYNQYPSLERQEVVPFCAVLFTQECFSRVGLLDEEYFVYWEDSDWCLQAKRKQLKLFYTPNTLIYHQGSALTQKNSYFYIKYITKGRFRFWRKNFKPLSRFSYYFIYLGLLLYLAPTRNLRVNYHYWINFIQCLFAREKN